MGHAVGIKTSGFKIGPVDFHGFIGVGICDDDRAILQPKPIILHQGAIRQRFRLPVGIEKGDEIGKGHSLRDCSRRGVFRAHQCGLCIHAIPRRKEAHIEIFLS